MRALLAHSLRARLLWLLLAAIILAAFVQTAIVYRTALAEADEIFDFQMQQMATSLRSGLPLGTNEAGRDSGHAEEENDEFIVQVWAADGLPIFQSAAETTLPRPAVAGFSSVRANKTTYRVFSLQTRSALIEVGQDMAVRREMAGSLALRAVGPIAVMAPLLMLIVWWVVSRSLAPLARMRRQVAEREADDLSPVSETGLPSEIRPLVRELNLLFERVGQAFHAQQHFVADAAHELRSPLAAVRLQAEGLQRAAGNEERDTAAARLFAGVDRAARLIEQLLVLARHEASVASRPRPQPVALADVARLAVADVLPAAQARRIDVGLGQADQTTVQGHPEALRILMRNLLDNAIKYTPCGGQVDLEVLMSHGRPVLSVEDSGAGIPAEDRERVLDRFYRVGGTPASGSGLGLAIVKAIVELHGASIALDASPRLGGLRVTVQFPVPG